LDHVVEATYQEAYLPFLKVMEQHPSIPWVLHNSGCLWEWLGHHHPEYVATVGRLVAAGQVELLGGGFYEPVLPALTPEDRRGQVTRMRDYLRERFGVESRGLWLAERVWEPDLPVDLVDAGVEYLSLDDTQFHQVGVPPERVRGAFQTESGGRLLRLFPALMSLRYKIPYDDPQAVADFLTDPFPGGGGGLAVYADDGEKFGGWPGTHGLVYGERWLDRFLECLEGISERVKCTTFAREARRREPLGLVYLPTGSYAEMGQWSLPPEHQEAYRNARQALCEAGQAREAELFVRGGFWRNFFARYPESNWMHMRSLRASERCRALRERLPSKVWQPAREHLWRAQCNCAYWHGVFGGIYLPHLRHGVYTQMIRGEAILARGLHGDAPWAQAREEDLDADGQPEIMAENDRLALFLDPDSGGRLVEWDDRAVGMNLVNVLSRRPEFYHRDVSANGEEGTPEAETIHGRVRSKEEGLAAVLAYDWYERACLSDRFFAEKPAVQALARGVLREAGDFVDQPYKARVQAEEGGLTVRLWREGMLRHAEAAQSLGVEKTIRLRAGERGFSVAYRYRNLSDAPLRIWAGIENHINLLAGDDPACFLLLNDQEESRAALGTTGATERVESVTLVEGRLGWHVRLRISPTAALFRYPVETVSLSEEGAERNYQGTALVFAFLLELTPGEERGVELRAEVLSGPREAAGR
jgi:alpha-amylase